VKHSKLFFLRALLLVLFAGFDLAASAQANRADYTGYTNRTNPPAKLKLLSAHPREVIGPEHPDVILSRNFSGFETGQVIKMDGTYHMFVNEMFVRPFRDLRISYWTSKDALNWERRATIRESIPGRSPYNPRSEVWVTGVEFNEDENAWNIFYVAYRAGDETKGEIARSDYSGRIWRAKSVIPGIKGIAGPYADMGIVLQPGEHSQAWEGQQAVASFNPYKVGDTWYAFYDGHNYIPQGGWPTGMARAEKLEGPWTRMTEDFNPLPIVDEFMENTVITQLKNGKYLAVFDSFGDREIGYSLSEDGLNWSKETRIKVQFEDRAWVKDGNHSLRTPLCAIEEDDGTFTVIYTGLMDLREEAFYAVGKCTLAWE